MKEITKEWLRHAKEDIDVIEELIETGNYANTIAFHSQQAIEKSFKAILDEYDIGVIKIHNLIRLHNKIKDFIKFEINLDTLNKVDLIYIDTRYPSLAGSLPNGMPSNKEAREFYELAKNIFDKISELLNKD